MAEFNLKIAGHVGKVHSRFDSTKDYCRNYLTDETPEFEVTVTPEDLAFEQAELLAEARAEGMKPRKFTDPFLDRAAIQRKFADYLFGHNILLCHGSTVAVDGKAYLFTAKCGTGKSTHTRLWREVFGDRARMVNDDKPFLILTENGVLACGAPWSGKHGLDTNITVPLAGICILERGPENIIRPIPAKEAVFMLLQQSNRPQDPRRMPKYLELLDKLSQQVTFYRLACNMSPEAALVAYEAMGRK